MVTKISSRLRPVSFKPSLIPLPTASSLPYYIRTGYSTIHIGSVLIEKTYGIGSINMTVASGDSGLDSIVDFFGLGLPSSQTDGRDSGASVAVDGMSGYVHGKRHIMKDRDLQLEDFGERHNEITSD